jgi:hypothetical protein
LTRATYEQKEICLSEDVYYISRRLPVMEINEKQYISGLQLSHIFNPGKYIDRVKDKLFYMVIEELKKHIKIKEYDAVKEDCKVLELSLFIVVPPEIIAGNKELEHATIHN